MAILPTSLALTSPVRASMAPSFRKLALLAHVTSSVGWFGSIATFLALSLIGAFTEDADTVRSAYLAMNSIGVVVIIPLCIASLVTGIVQSLVSPWGLFRHYWVLSKLALNLLATALLVLHQYSAVAVAARRALAAPAGALPNVGRLSTQLAFESSLAVLALLTATALSIYKPAGVTAYGQSRLAGRSRSNDASGAAAGASVGMKFLLAIVGAVLAVAAMVHLTGLGGPH